ncbi:uncharacterized protein LOC127586716 isoform X5 [Pristis pectinata]|uniref:uncharacterized protein LOC127586716 isoform X5 n=1 Tax=Pristis pectinata TaxID=685728 RepID=UPI00223CC4F6|nr:uncharacterized protein LOC127586716 isoform X5 [Pristis pectinata]
MLLGVPKKTAPGRLSLLITTLQACVIPALHFPVLASLFHYPRELEHRAVLHRTGHSAHSVLGEKSAALETIRPNPPTRLGFLQALLSSKAVLRKRRERSRGTAGSGPKHRAVVAAHFEVPSVTDNGIYIVEKGGIIRQWAERSFQARPRPLSYKQHDGRDSR